MFGFCVGHSVNHFFMYLAFSCWNTKNPSPTCVESTVFQNVIVWCGIKNSLLQISGIVISLSSFSSLSHPGHRQVHVHKMVILSKIQADFQWPDLMENDMPSRPPGKFLLTGDIYKSELQCCIPFDQYIIDILENFLFKCLNKDKKLF